MENSKKMDPFAYILFSAGPRYVYLHSWRMFVCHVRQLSCETSLLFYCLGTALVNVLLC